MIRSWIVGSALWASQNITRPDALWAADAARILKVRQALHSEAEGQKYWRLVIETSARRAARITQDGQTVTIVLEDCRTGDWKRVLRCDGQIASKAVITADQDGNSRIAVALLPRKMTPPIHCYYLPGIRSRTSSRLVIDIGDKLRERLKSIAVKETDLKFGPLEMRTETNLLVVHHVGCTDRDVPASEIHRWHLANGWSGIGYHYAVHKDGTIERGRPMDSVGAHVYGFNGKSIGVVVVGNFEQAVPTEAQLKSAATLLAELCRLYQIQPGPQTIVGHRDLLSTACPGRNLYSKIQNLRDRVRDCR